jgi:hypothetical protein
MPRRIAFALTLILLSATSLRAEVLPTLPLRELTTRADVVVLASPLDPARPGRFRVRDLLKGASPRPGAELEVAGLDVYLRPKELPDWDKVDAVLLFLRKTAGGQFEPVESGLRLQTRDRTVWWPVQPQNPGGYHMLPERGVRWDAAYARVRFDAAEASRFQAARELADVGRRDRALFEWVERHRNEFVEGVDLAWMQLTPSVRNLGDEETDARDLDAFGWGELQLTPFLLVLQGRLPADCLRAVHLFAELNQGSILPGAAAALASREGRGLLLSTARDGRQLAGNRARALRLLGDPQATEKAPPDDRERTELVDGLLTLLADGDPACRALAARAVVRTAGRGGAASEPAETALARAYKAEAPGPVRNALAETLYGFVDSKRWTALTGRPGGSLALMRDVGIRDEHLFFWVSLATEPAATVKETPVLVVEWLDAKGTVKETKKVSLTHLIPSGPDGWHGSPRHVELTHIDMKPGTIRMTVTGVAGPEKRPWTSEPRTLRVEMSGPASNRPQRSVLGGLLRTITGESDRPVPEMSPQDRARRKVILDGEPL